MPDRSDRQFVLGDPECPFRLGELDVSLPERGRFDLCEITPQDIATVGQSGPLGPAGVATPGDLQAGLPRGFGQALDRNLEGPRGTPVLLKQPAQATVRHTLVTQVSGR